MISSLRIGSLDAVFPSALTQSTWNSLCCWHSWWEIETLSQIWFRQIEEQNQNSQKLSYLAYICLNCAKNQSEKNLTQLCLQIVYARELLKGCTDFAPRLSSKQNKAKRSPPFKLFRMFLQKQTVRCFCSFWINFAFNISFAVKRKKKIFFALFRFSNFSFLSFYFKFTFHFKTRRKLFLPISQFSVGWGLLTCAVMYVTFAANISC